MFVSCLQNINCVWENKSKSFLDHFSKRAFFFLYVTAVGWPTHWSNFVAEVADWTEDIFPQGNFVVCAPDWLYAPWRWLVKFQYLWNKFYFYLFIQSTSSKWLLPRRCCWWCPCERLVPSRLRPLWLCLVSGWQSWRGRPVRHPLVK